MAFCNPCNPMTMQSRKWTEKELDRIIEMAWEDRTPFEAILFQFGLPEKDVIKLMRTKLKASSYKLWRKRVNSGVSQKHLKTESRNNPIQMFKTKDHNRE